VVDAATGNGNGNGHAGAATPVVNPASPEVLAELRQLSTQVLHARLQFARMAGMSFGDKRDLYAILGYPRQLTTKDYRDRYARGGIAGRIVDVFPNATWRSEFDVVEDEDPNKETEFEAAWKAQDTRLQIRSKLLRADKLAGQSTYAVLLIGAPGELDQELPQATKPEDLLFLQPFSGGGGPAGENVNTTIATGADCTIATFVTDASDPRFGMPQTYQLRRTDFSSPNFQKPVHWTRIIHIAENTLETDVYGQPVLERIWNLLDDLDKCTGGGAEAFWLRANQGLHLDIDKDMELDDATAAIENLKKEAELYQHQATRWLRTRGVDVKTLGSDVANFSNPADAILTQIAGAKGIPKRILTGSEMGELASSQDRDNWRDQIIGRQGSYAGPYIVRPLIDRLIKYGYLPTPKKGANAYEVKWPQIQTLTETERAEGAQKWANTKNADGTPTFTTSEIRDKWYGYAPLTAEQIAAQKQLSDSLAPGPPPDEGAGGFGGAFPRAASGIVDPVEQELVAVLAAALKCGATDVVDAIVGVPR
jgi:uncharacterized protein